MKCIACDKKIDINKVLKGGEFRDWCGRYYLDTLKQVICSKCLRVNNNIWPDNK